MNFEEELLQPILMARGNLVKLIFEPLGYSTSDKDDDDGIGEGYKLKTNISLPKSARDNSITSFNDFVEHKAKQVIFKDKDGNRRYPGELGQLIYNGQLIYIDVPPPSPPRVVWDFRMSMARMRQGPFDYGSIEHESKHWCACYVRRMLESGGIYPASTRMDLRGAMLYKDVLPRLGFLLIRNISTITEGDKWTAQYGQPGDICVTPGENGGNPRSYWGHICMLNDRMQWTSDFYQNHMIVFATYLLGQVFRYTGKIIF